MFLNNQQLKNWSRQGTITKSKITYDLIKKALKRCNEKYCRNQLSYEIYLQGSYKNSTNISESDIDVVIQLNSIHLDNLNKQNISVEKAFDIWYEFRLCILEILEEEFKKENVSIGNKSLKIETIDELAPIDVIPCLQYRKYLKDSQRFDTGITFWHMGDSHQIIHFPKNHYFNGVLKQRFTNNTYKSIVRILKNIRHELINNSSINKEDSSSYFLECLLYNVPDEKFTGNYQKALYEAVKYLDRSDLKNFRQQHNDKNFGLFGDNPEQWDIDLAHQFLHEIKYFVKNS